MSHTSQGTIYQHPNKVSM